MEFAQIKDLINTVNHSPITNFELTFENCTIKISKDSQPVQPEISAAPTPPQVVSVPVPTTELPITIMPEEKPKLDGHFIYSPIVGIFYSASHPDKPPFVKVGDKVKQGDLLCILEAMKVMNEITSDMDGEILEILVENEEMVEYKKPLFRIG